MQQGRLVPGPRRKRKEGGAGKGRAGDRERAPPPPLKPSAPCLRPFGAQPPSNPPPPALAQCPAARPMRVGTHLRACVAVCEVTAGPIGGADRPPPREETVQGPAAWGSRASKKQPRSFCVCASRCRPPAAAAATAAHSPSQACACFLKSRACRRFDSSHVSCAPLSISFVHHPRHYPSPALRPPAARPRQTRRPRPTSPTRP
jgi:hypothetical protein